MRGSSNARVMVTATSPKESLLRIAKTRRRGTQTRSANERRALMDAQINGGRAALLRFIL